MIIAITAGEPAGIGPDILIQLAQTGLPAGCVVISNAQLLHTRAKQLGLLLIVQPFTGQAPEQCTQTITLIDIPLEASITPGIPSVHSAAHVIACLTRAVDGALSGEFAAITTAPVHKGILCDAGFAFSGHTEFFAHACQIKKPVMMLANPLMRVALVTTHVSIKMLPSLITRDNILQTCRIVTQDLRELMGIAAPHLTVLGLNPHAGEGGHLGDEEITQIIPAIEQLQSEGINIIGPLPADTAFTQPTLSQTDAFIAMYHDQALPVIKFSDFTRTVNITLGLPIIRTSVDHGTACALAGTGKADARNLSYAIDAAITFAHQRHST
jgi:4-hydroxythreonine-4-phosphate dehydrogenase